MKCHLCNNELTESSFDIWNVGNRRCVLFLCTDTQCSSIGIPNRADYEVILPNQEIVAYRLVIRYGERYFRVSGNAHYVKPTTSFSAIDLTKPRKDEFLFSVERFYTLPFEEGIGQNGYQLVEKFKKLIVFS